MKKHKRIIHVIGLNSFKFNELSIDVQDLLIKLRLNFPELPIKEIEKKCYES